MEWKSQARKLSKGNFQLISIKYFLRLLSTFINEHEYSLVFLVNQVLH